MSTNLPATLWRPTDGYDEMGQSDSGDITTLSGLGITALSGIQLIVLPGSYTPLPATGWSEDDGV